MKSFRLLVVLAALLFAGVLAPAPARARVAVSFDFFYDSLAPYGDWVQVGDYGLCWRPGNVDPDWAPYSDGYWAFTEAGWTWVSYEDFGAIVYHYGRWIRLDDNSWCWAPDYEWAPAWVSWRSSDDYVGWAPLPPEAHWRRDVGISVWVDRVCDIGPGYYNFCRIRDFGAPVLRGVIVNRGENVTIIRGTVNVTNITYNTGYSGGPVIFNGGPNFEVINQFCARPVPALRLVQNANFDAAHWREHRGPGGRLAFSAQTVGNQLIVTAPLVAPPTDPSAFQARAKKVFAADRVSHGWGAVKSPEVQKELRQEINRQSKGLTPETAPARAVAAADLHVVPSKADPHAATSTIERIRKGGPGAHPESVVVQPNNLPPNAPPAGTSPLKPFHPSNEPRSSQNPPAGTVSQPPRGPAAAEPTVVEKLAEQSRIRAEEERKAQPKPKQTSIIAPQDTARAQAEEARRREVIEQQRQSQPPQPALPFLQQPQKKQQQTPPKDQSPQLPFQQQPKQLQQQQQQQEQLQQKQGQQQQQREQQQEQLQRKQQQQQEQQQQQLQRTIDAHRAQQEERERSRQQNEAQRSLQIQQQQEKHQQQQGNQPPGNSPHPGNGHSKDKDKDKDKNGN